MVMILLGCGGSWGSWDGDGGSAHDDHGCLKQFE